MSKKKKDTNEESLFSKFKSVWSVPRYKALIKLGLYVVFFAAIFLIGYIGTLTNPKSNSSTSSKEEVAFDSYTYVYKINKHLGDKIDTITYSGTYTSSTNSGLIKYSDGKTSTYVINDDDIYIDSVISDSLYDVVASNYFSYEYLDNILRNNKDGNYIDEYNNTITIKRVTSSNKKKYDIDFSTKYKSSEYDKITVELEIYNIN